VCFSHVPLASSAKRAQRERSSIERGAQMRIMTLILTFAAALWVSNGCAKKVSDNDAVRAGIHQHLVAVGTLNMNAMDMDIRSLSVNGNQAHAEVEFRPKGNPSGAGMQVAYNLEKRDGAWVVSKTQPLGGMIQHPDPNQNPQSIRDVHSGTLPNFKEMLNSTASPAQGVLPPGHPALGSSQSNSPSNTQAPSPNVRQR
jgi:hypothetical protein